MQCDNSRHADSETMKTRSWGRRRRRDVATIESSSASLGNRTELHREIIVEPMNKNKKDALNRNNNNSRTLTEAEKNAATSSLCITRPVLIIAFITMVMLEVNLEVLCDKPGFQNLTFLLCSFRSPSLAPVWPAFSYTNEFLGGHQQLSTKHRPSLGRTICPRVISIAHLIATEVAWRRSSKAFELTSSCRRLAASPPTRPTWRMRTPFLRVQAAPEDR